MPSLAGYLCFLPLILCIFGYILFLWGLLERKRNYLTYIGLVLIVIAIIAVCVISIVFISILFDIPIGQLRE